MNKLKFIGMASIIIFIFASCLPQLAIAKKRKCPKPCNQKCPAPVVSPTPTPCPKEITEIRWDMAVEIIKSGIVTFISQSHSLGISFTLKDGTRFTTKEPNIDAVFTVVNECGLPCQDIFLGTE